MGNPNHGCPLNGPGWVQLGSAPISGTFQWHLKEITVTPTQDIRAIAIGPDCTEVIYSFSTYYFFDKLVLAEENDFKFLITAEGHPCSRNITLQLPQRDTLQYQWYRDGIALPGQTGPVLEGVAEEGSYQVRVLGPNSCRITPAYRYRIPIEYAFIEHTTCMESPYFFKGKNIPEGGVYWDTLKTAENCDSIVRLTLEVIGGKADTVFAKILEGESYRVGKQSFTSPGRYDLALTSRLGCDSLVHLVLDFYKVFIPNAFSPNGDGINDVFTLFAGGDVQEVLELKVFDRWGGLVFDKKDLSPGSVRDGWDGSVRGRPAPAAVYAYEVFVVFDDGKRRLLKGAVQLMR